MLGIKVADVVWRLKVKVGLAWGSVWQAVLLKYSIKV